MYGFRERVIERVLVRQDKIASGEVPIPETSSIVPRVWGAFGGGVAGVGIGSMAAAAPGLYSARGPMGLFRSMRATPRRQALGALYGGALGALGGYFAGPSIADAIYDYHTARPVHIASSPYYQ